MRQRVGRLWHWVRTRTGVTGAFILIVALFAFGLNQAAHQRDELQRAICGLAQGFSNALVHSVPQPANEQERAATQAKVDAFQRNVEQQVSSANCHIHLDPIPPPPGG